MNMTAMIHKAWALRGSPTPHGSRIRQEKLYSMKSEIDEVPRHLYHSSCWDAGSDLTRFLSIPPLASDFMQAARREELQKGRLMNQF